jgi:hypothetical protein
MMEAAMAKLDEQHVDHSGEKELEMLAAEIRRGELTPNQSSGEVDSNYVQFFHNGNSATLVISNQGTSPATTNYIIRVLDGDDGRWKLHTQGHATVQPNTTFNQGFHKWRAADWNASWVVRSGAGVRCVISG